MYHCMHAIYTPPLHDHIVSENDGIHSTMSYDTAVCPCSCLREIGITFGVTICPIIVAAMTVVVVFCCWR